VSVSDDVLETTAAFHHCGSKGEPAVVDHLIELGYSPLRAEILLVFIPLGLGRAIIKRVPGGATIKLPEIALIRDSNGSDRTISLRSVPEFVVAQEMGEETFTTGVIPREQYAASCFSVEFNLLNQMLNKDVDIAGATMSPSILLRLSDAPGFEEWYRKLARPRETRQDAIRFR
jgi:hypothetical protein